MSDIFDHVNVELSCEQCGGSTTTTVGVLRDQKTVTCECGCELSLDEDRLEEEIARARQSIAALQATVKDLSKFSRK